MDFFNSLSLDLKLLAVGIAGCALLALFSGNAKTEKKYVLVLAVLAAAGIYRFNHTLGAEQATATAAAARAAVPVAAPAPRRAQLSSTAAK